MTGDEIPRCYLDFRPPAWVNRVVCCFFSLDDIMGRGVLDIFLLHSCSCTFRNQNLSTSVHILSTLSGVIALDWSLHKPINLHIYTSGDSITIYWTLAGQTDHVWICTLWKGSAIATSCFPLRNLLPLSSSSLFSWMYSFFLIDLAPHTFPQISMILAEPGTFEGKRLGRKRRYTPRFWAILR